MTTDFRLYLLTWNVGETFPPKDLTKLLGLNGKTLPNLYAVGLQEMKSSTASRVSDLVFEDSWTTAITDCLSTRNYVRIKMRRLLGIHISVYVRRIDLPYIANVESECTKTGLGGFWGNKGAVSIRLDAFGVNICIVNAHFTAHSENVSQRLEDYNIALETQRFRDKNSETILDHEYVFWIGDLNFRIDGISNEEVRKRAAEKDFAYLSKYDQLTKAIKEELIFLDFFEGPLNFPPTFKFDVGTDVYDTSAKNRVPSYCDRVLWRVHEDSYEDVSLSVKQLSYGCIMDEKTSDHKPVYSEFIIQVLKSPPELPVMFEPMGGWCRHKDNEVSYLVSSGLAPNSRDWIGLYREGYKNWFDYVTYVWASVEGEDMHDGSHMHSVSFESRYLQRLPPDTYYLLYFSFIKNCVVGYSDGFRLLMTEESSASSSDVDGDENSVDLKSDGPVFVSDFSSNGSRNDSKFPSDRVDSERFQATVRSSVDKGQRSEGVKEPSRDCRLVPSGQKEPASGGEEKSALGEPPVPVHSASNQLLHSEPNKTLIAKSEKPVGCELNKPALDESENLLCDRLMESVLNEPEPVLVEQKQPFFAGNEEMIRGDADKFVKPLDSTELVASESVHQATTGDVQCQPLLGERKEQRPEQRGIKALDPVLKEPLQKDLHQSLLNDEQQFEKHEHKMLPTSEQTFPGNQDQLGASFRSDKKREQPTTSAEGEKSPPTELAHHVLSDRVVPAPSVRRDVPDPEQITCYELVHQPKQDTLSHLGQTPVALLQTAGIVVGRNLGTSSQITSADRSISDDVCDDKM